MSLFGFDPAYDFISLTRQSRSRRINAALPEESLMLLKPHGEVEHEGGTVLQPGDGLYDTLIAWVNEGANNDTPETTPALTFDL